MALIPCPECHHEVSDQAEKCPQCGYPLKRQAAPPITELDDRLLEILASEGKIAAIKHYRVHAPGVSLAEAKEHVDRLQAAHPFRYSAPMQGNLNGNFVGCLYLFIALILCLVLWVIEPRMSRSWRRDMHGTPPPVSVPAGTP